MKKTIDFSILWYLALAMAFVSLLPSVGMESLFATLSSGIFLFLESMSLVIYLFGIAMTSWFLVSKKSIVTIKQDPSKAQFSQPAQLPVSYMKIVLIVFCALTPQYPNQIQILFLLVANSFARLCLTLLTRKSLAKAQELMKSKAE